MKRMPVVEDNAAKSKTWSASRVQRDRGVRAGADRLTDRATRGMGHLFKVMGLAGPNQPALPRSGGRPRP
jgi:hypothetical protein